MKLDDSSEGEASDDDFNAVRLGPRSPPKPTQRKGRFFSDDEAPEPTARRRIASSDEESEKNESSIEFLGSDPPSSPKARRAAVRRRVDPYSDDSEADEAPRRKLRPRRHQSDSDSPRLRRRSASPKPRKRRRSNLRPDPDDEASASAATEDEDARAEIEMDEPERFTATSRLRETKESAWAANLRRLKESRGGNAAEYVSSGSDEGDWAYEREDELDDFLVSDDGEMPEELPEEFSHKRESTEYKFKVVFQYLLLLAIKGPDVLPLSKSDADYFGRQLRDVRNLMKGFRDSLSSTLWKPEFRKALETYPVWQEANLTEREEYCDGCNRRNQRCYRTAWLRGQPYDRESHEVLEGSDNEDADSEEEADPRVLGNLGKLRSPQMELTLGSKCLQRAHDFHELHHWEHQMFSFIKSQYNDLVRAAGQEVRESSLASDSDMSGGEHRELARRRGISAGRVQTLSRGPLPNDVEDVDEVTEWMDSHNHMRKSLEWLDRVEGRARRLERHY